MDAPKKVFISYSRDTKAHAARVRGLADSLRRDGVDCTIDQYIPAGPPEAWPLWMEKTIEWADFVLMVCTRTYLRRVRKEEKPGEGLGVTWEAHLIYQHVYESGAVNSKFIPVVFNKKDKEHIPTPLRSVNHYRLDGQDGYDELYAVITGQRSAVKPPIGTVKPVPSEAAAPTFAPPGFSKRRDNFLEAGVALNQNFLGRDRELEQLHTRLEQGNVAIVHALTGEGGVGKTELAKAYVLSRAADYTGRWWLDASEGAVEASTVAALEAVTGIPIASQATPDQIRSALCRALSEGKHLLVLDNVENPKRLEAFQLRPPSRVLATTKRTDLPAALVTSFEVEVLDPDDAVALLRKHREDLSGPEREKALGSVVEFLGCHTLAVALAGEYLRKFPNVTPRELLTRLKEDEVGAKGFTLDEIESDKLGTSYQRNVAASLGLHVPEFANTPAMDLLGLAAFCHPTAIPVDLLCDAVKLDQREVERWLANLRDVSIIGYKKTVSIHRLTQSLIRQRLGEDGQREALGGLIAALAPKFENADDHTRWESIDAYAPHALAALPHAERLGRIDDAGFVANQVGLYLRGRVRFDDALEALQTAERIARASFGDNHPKVAACVNNIGSVLKAQGDLEGALEKFREAERIDRTAFGDDDPKVATDVNNIGSVLEAQGDLDGALQKFREAERIDRAALGDDDPEVATDINNIGSVLQDKGDLDGALQKYREAEPIDRAAFGDDHPKVAIRVNNIGAVLSAKGDFAGALEKFREAERIDRAAFGDDHPNVATDVNNIGSVLHDQGNLDGALQKFREAERIDRAAFGDDHPNVARGVNNIGSVLQDKGDLEGALEKYREAERIDRFAFGDDHPKVAIRVNNIGSVLSAKGDFAGALEKFREAERIDRAAFGDDHPMVAIRVNNIGSVLNAKGDKEGAAECYERAFRILLRAHGPRGQNTVSAAQNLLALDIDPIPIAREVAGDEAAEGLAAALAHE